MIEYNKTTASLKIIINRKITAIFLFMILISQFYAQENNPSFEPFFNVNEILNHKNESGNYISYDADEVFELGLLFSECERNSELWKKSWKKFEHIKQIASSAEMKSLELEERGRAVLKFLYQDYLKTYSLKQTKIDVALETGEYNCVSSAVIYMAAAKAAGIDVRGQKTTQHAFCSIYVPGIKEGQLKKIDVETTNPYGFNPGSREEVEHEDQIKKYYVVPKKFYGNRSEVSDGIFTGLIAGNLCSEYIRLGNYTKAIPLGAARWDLVKNESGKSASSVRKEFDILPANYINLVQKSALICYSRLNWFSSFIDRWGNTALLQKNLDTSFINLLVLCNSEFDYALAKTSYEEYKDKISQTQMTKADEILTDLIISKTTAGLSAELKIQETNRLLLTEELSQPVRQRRAQLHLESFWLDYLNIFMNSREFEAGYSTALIAANQMPKSSKIKNIQNIFYNNIIVQIHNDFVKQARAENYSSAKKILEEGLERFPNDKTLKKDLLDLQKVMNAN